MSDTPSQRDAILALWAEGLTSGQVAQKLGVSRSVVMGAIYRARQHGTAVDPEGRHVVSKRAAPPPQPLLVKLTPVAKLNDRSSGEKGVRLIRLRATGCRFPVGTNRKGEHLFCNSHQQEGSSYCQRHHQVTHVKPTPQVKRKVITWRM